MRDDTAWSVVLFRRGSVHVRLHMFFLLFASITLYFGWLASRQFADPNLFTLAAVSLVLLFAAVLLHAIGHLAVLLHVGGRVDAIVLQPHGGVPIPSPAHEDPQAELIRSLAGPAMNLLAAVSLLLPLWLLGGSSLVRLLNPLQPAVVSGSTVWLDVLHIAFWINWLLLLVNLVPAFPFDGGNAARALVRLSRPEMGPEAATRLVARIAKIAALGLLVAAVLVRDVEPVGLVPVWLVLVLLALTVFFSANQYSRIPRQKPSDEPQELFGYDFSQGYTSLERSLEPQPPEPNFLRRWMQARRDARRQREQELAKREETLADEILARLHQGGIESLSAADRALLQRVSARYRNRHSQSM